MKKFKTIIAASLVVAVGGIPGVASADEYAGSLGTAATATDKWYFSCTSTNTSQLRVRIRRSAGTPCVRVQSTSPAYNVTSCSTTFTSQQILSTGSGVKSFTVTKNPQASGAASYVVDAHCWRSTGVHGTQTTPQTYLQNQ